MNSKKIMAKQTKQILDWYVNKLPADYVGRLIVAISKDFCIHTSDGVVTVDMRTEYLHEFMKIKEIVLKGVEFDFLKELWDELRLDYNANIKDAILRQLTRRTEGTLIKQKP